MLDQTHRRTREPKRATRPAGPPNRDTTDTCSCRRLVGATDDGRGNLTGGQYIYPGKPQLVATFHNGELATIERIHWAGRDRCPMPTEHLDPQEWART